MRSHRFTVNLPGANSSPGYVDVSAVGTGLDGIAIDTPCAVSEVGDTPSTVSGDGIVTVRVSALDTLRFRCRGVPSGGVTRDLIVTELV